MARLGDFCDINMGQSPDSSSYNDAGQGLPFYQGNADFGVRYPTPRVYCSQPCKIAHKGDVLISVRAPIGALNIANETCCIGRGLAAIAIDENKCSKEYFWYAIAAKVDELNAKGTGSTFKAISKSVLFDTNIVLPALNEQKKAYGCLSLVDELISLRKKQLQKLDDLVKSRFVEMFGNPIINEKGFETKPGSDVFKLSNGVFVPESKRFQSGIPVYGGNGISWYTDESLYENDTIVVGRVGFQSGNVHLVKGPLWISDNAMYISGLFDQEYDLPFLCCVMEHIDFTRYQDAGDLKKITQKPFMKMKFIKPPVTLQRKYLGFVDKVNKSKLTVQQGLDKLEQLKQSLMQKYFG